MLEPYLLNNDKTRLSKNRLEHGLRAAINTPIQGGAADIVIAAIGQAHFLNASMIKEGAAVIDVGISRTEAGLLGDVHPDVMEKAGFVAPMPGGVGPMTRAMLVTNVVDACSQIRA